MRVQAASDMIWVIYIYHLNILLEVGFASSNLRLNVWIQNKI
jgi:hypothetical protein